MTEDEVMPVESKIDKSKDLTTHIFTGEISSNDLISVVESFFKGELTKNLLLDCRNAKPDERILSQDLEKIAGVTKRYWELRKTGKTAIVASTDIVFGLSRMYEAFVKIEGLTHSVKVFRSMDEAIEWLDL